MRLGFFQEWQDPRNVVRLAAEVVARRYYDVRGEVHEDEILDHPDVRVAVAVTEALWADEPLKWSVSKLQEVSFNVQTLHLEALNEQTDTDSTVALLGGLYHLMRVAKNIKLKANAQIILANTAGVLEPVHLDPAARSMIVEAEAEWRYEDLTHGHVLPQPVRDAFIAAWMIGEYTFAAQLVAGCLTEPISLGS